MKKALRIGVTIIVCAAIVVGYYYYLSRKNDKTQEQEALTRNCHNAIVEKYIRGRGRVIHQ